MQPQSASHVAATCQGDVPIAGMAELFIEVSPGNEMFRVTDIALKAADVRPALQIVEREFGLMEIHSRQPGRSAGRGPGRAGLSRPGREGPGPAEDRLGAVRHQRQPVPGAADQQMAQGQPADAGCQPVRAGGGARRLRHAWPPTRPRRRPTSRSSRSGPSAGSAGCFSPAPRAKCRPRATRPCSPWSNWTARHDHRRGKGRNRERSHRRGTGDVVTPLARDRASALGVELRFMKILNKVTSRQSRTRRATPSHAKLER